MITDLVEKWANNAENAPRAPRRVGRLDLKRIRVTRSDTPLHTWKPLTSLDLTMGGQNVIQDSDEEDVILPSVPDPPADSTQLTVSTIIDLSSSSPTRLVDLPLSADQSTESTGMTP